MKISGINNIFKFPELQNTEKKANSDFGNIFTDFVKQVNTDQINSSEVTRDFIEGKDVELHQVMIAGEKASTSLELLMEIRNKAIDMYKEITRMQ